MNIKVSFIFLNEMVNFSTYLLIEYFKMKCFKIRGRSRPGRIGNKLLQDTDQTLRRFTLLVCTSVQSDDIDH